MLDKNAQPFTDAQLRARLDPRAQNQPLDKTISIENITYSTEDYDYQLFDTETQTVKKEGGEASVPFIVYSDRKDCLTYEVSLFWQGKQASTKTETYCLTLGEPPTSYFLFKSDQYVPINLKDLLKYLPILLGCIFISFFLYRIYYYRMISRSDDPDRAEIYKDKALALWGLPNFLCSAFIIFASFPHNPWIWGIIGVLGILSLSLLLFIIFK